MEWGMYSNKVVISVHKDCERRLRFVCEMREVVRGTVVGLSRSTGIWRSHRSGSGSENVLVDQALIIKFVAMLAKILIFAYNILKTLFGNHDRLRGCDDGGIGRILRRRTGYGRKLVGHKVGDDRLFEEHFWGVRSLGTGEVE